MTAQTGHIYKWNDTKGFGFIKSAQGEEIFFHISAFQGQGRPQIGSQVNFVRSVDEQNRTRALKVMPVQAFKAKPLFNVKLWLGLAALLLLAALAFNASFNTGNQAPVSQAQFDPELSKTLALIAQGGPYPHRQDGTVFHNREQKLPSKPRGYYHEFTVRTPGVKNRGARRVVTGGEPPEVYYYTEDHYQNFVMLKVPAHALSKP